MSVSGAIAYRWDGRSARLYFQTKTDNFDIESLKEFLIGLKRHLRGDKAILIWDGLPAHKSTNMKDWIATQRAWLEVVFLPGYAPDLNPVESLWGNLKGQELANRCFNDLGEIFGAVDTGLTRARNSRDLLFGFLHHAGLSI